MPKHYEESLERDVSRIRDKVAEMARLAERAVRDAVTAFQNRNRKLAYSVILRDQSIDELEKEIDRLCLEFIVRQQPVGSHLRFAFATIKINSELERVGDYAESIARQTLTICALPFEMPREPFEEIAQLALPMLRAATRAFLTRDAEAAREAMVNEDQVDLRRHSFGTELIEWREREEIPLAAFAPFLNVVNRLERVGDQARSIAQEAIYVATGQYAKHQGSDVIRILLVDERNACLSPMAEAIGAALDQPRFVFSSAGTDPRELVDGATAFFLEQKGFRISRNKPRSIAQVPNFEHYQVVVALTDEARHIFPPPPSKAVCLEWQLVDPTTQTLSRAEAIEGALESAYQTLSANIQDLVEAILGNDSRSSDTGVQS